VGWQIAVPWQAAQAARVALLALVYLAAARLSLSLAIPPGYATPVWPPSGLAVAAVLLLGKRIWPGIWAGAFAANLSVEASVFSAVVIACGNTIEALVAGALAGRWVAGGARFRRTEHVFGFIAIAALSACIAATLALVPLALGHALPLQSALRNWWTWWQGDFTGIILFAPLILSWSTREGAAWPAGRRTEAAAFALLLVATAVAISGDAASHFVPFSLTFVALPYIIWAAFRFGQREVTSAVAAVCAVAVWYAIDRRDLFAAVPLNELLLMLLTFISMVVATGLVLATLAGEHREALHALREKGARLAPVAGPHGHARLDGRREARELEDELRNALESEEFVLHYQPKVDVDTRRLAGLEALMRWNSPKRGFVPPLSFIPVLEESGLIVQAGRWAMRRAVTDQAWLASQGSHVPRIAVNLSAVQLRQPDFVDSVRDALNGGSAIDIEITESRIMEDIDANLGKLEQLRDLGMRIAIDDFGTGYSSLAYLAKLPVHTLKIDRVFIDGMLGDDEMMAVVQTIISLAHSLDLETVAEGVETEAQADVLALLRCERMQGYLVSKPLPLAELAGLLPGR
jgi:EAL domain-containing protein (putative c-di-GMP-specific phosphodiesterase class I)/integral membrane sensor domain MASE1